VKRYVFSLQRVLRVRTTQETVARQALRTAAEHAAHADEDYDLKLRNYEANVASAASLRGTVLNMLALRGAASMRAREVIDAEQRRDDAHQQLATAHDDWVGAKQKVGALESLDDKQRTQHRAAQEAAEQAEIDDMVNARRARRATEPPNGEAPR
jgi:flagellar export protein FliJ